MKHTPSVEAKHWLILVRFEQGRGQSGVPKTWVPYLIGHPKDPQAKPEVETLAKQAVALLRVACADPNVGHGRDLMPGSDDEYQLHDLDGGRITSVEDLNWRDFAGEQRCEVVLTWRSPADLLMEVVS